MSNHIASDLDLPTRRVANETKPATRTTEFIVYILTVVGVLVLLAGLVALGRWLKAQSGKGT